MSGPAPFQRRAGAPAQVQIPAKQALICPCWPSQRRETPVWSRSSDAGIPRRTGHCASPGADPARLPAIPPSRRN